MSTTSSSGVPDHAGTQVTPAVTAGGWRAYAKLLVYVLFTVATAVATLIDGGGTAAEWLQVIAQAVSVAGVWIASNTVPGARYAKAIIAAAGAALTIAIPAVLEGGDGFTAGTITNMILAVAGALGVWAVPNTTAGGENVQTVAARVA
jgi:hypothetical protein